MHKLRVVIVHLEKEPSSLNSRSSVSDVRERPRGSLPSHFEKKNKSVYVGRAIRAGRQTLLSSLGESSSSSNCRGGGRGGGVFSKVKSSGVS